jgi:protein KRI1
VNAEKERLREELRRLKNLKKREIEQKLQSIARVAGVSALPIAGAALDEDEWDPETHEAMMGSAFGSAYYDLSDEDEGELKKPQFDDMDDELKELLTSQKVGERGFADAVKRAEARAQDLGDEEDEDVVDDEQLDGDAAVPDADGEGNRFSKRAMKKWKRCALVGGCLQCATNMCRADWSFITLSPYQRA